MIRLIKTGVVMFFVALIASFQASAKSPERIFEDASASIVIVDVLSASGEKIGHGSGVVVAAGTVVTNCHVTDEATFLQVRWKDKVHSAAFVYGHSNQDLCIVSAPDLKAPKVDLGAVQNVKIGSRVFAVGAPRGLELTMSDGIVSGLRHIDGTLVIQTNAAISPGSSGGGLFNEDAQLIGITTWLIRESQNLNFALAADLIPELQIKMEVARNERTKQEKLKNQRQQEELKKLAEAKRALELARQQLDIEKRKRDETMGIAEEAQRLEDQRRELNEEILRIQQEVRIAGEKGSAEEECRDKVPGAEAVVGIRRLQPKIKFKPFYPREALRMGVEGKVRVRMLVDGKGKVCAVTVLESSPKGVFEKVATETVKKYVYEADGTEFSVEQEFFFRVEDTREAEVMTRQDAEPARYLKDEFIGKIKAKIEQNTFAPEGLTGNPRAEFKIVLLPTGEVLSATLVKSSGNPAYDEAVERSIYKSAPLPLPPNNPELFREFRELRLPFTYVRR
jgi:TonB family protein